MDLGFEEKVLGLGVGPGWFVGGARYGRGGVEPAVEVYHRYRVFLFMILLISENYSYFRYIKYKKERSHPLNNTFQIYNSLLIVWRRQIY